MKEMLEKDSAVQDPGRLSAVGANALGQMIRVTQRVVASEKARTKLYRRAGWLAAVSMFSSYSSVAAAALGSVKAISALGTVAVATGLGMYAWQELNPTVPPPREPVVLPARPVLKDSVLKDTPLLRPAAPEPSATTPPAAPPKVTPKVKAAKRPASPADLLSTEIRLIDAARTALQAAQAGDALAQLARYRTQFPGGRFAIEASALQIEALALAGQKAQARVLAQQFIARHPQSLLAARVKPYAAAGASE